MPKDITATFEPDVLGVKSLSLEEDRKKFLVGLALWKIGASLANKASFDPRSRSTGPSFRLRADSYLTCDESIPWSGNSATGSANTSPCGSAGPIASSTTTASPFPKAVASGSAAAIASRRPGPLVITARDLLA